MPHQLGTLVRHLRKIAGPSAALSLSDGHLLERYLSCQDESAFAALVRRYGRLVRAVCWRVLRHEQDTDDAFQATFLLLATKAASIRKHASLGSWLHGVAYRIAMNAKRAGTRRTREKWQPERRAEPGPVTEAALRELQLILEEEVARLPDKYRAPFVACYLEGKSREEVARELGCKEGTLSSRLARACAELKRRLTRRGVALPAALCEISLSHEASAAVSTLLLARTVRLALAYAGGQAGIVPPPVIALIQGVTRTMFATKFHFVTVVLVTMGLLAGSTGLLVATAAERQSSFGAADLDRQPIRRPHAKLYRSLTDEKSMTLPQVKSALKEQRDKIKSLYVEYDIKPKMLIDDLKLLARWELLMVEDYSRTDHIAFKGPKRYLRQLTHSAVKVMLPQVDPDSPKDVQERQQKRIDDFEKFANIARKDVPESDNIHAFNGKAAWNYAVIDGKPLSDGRYTLSDPEKTAHGGNFQSEYLMNIMLELPGVTIPEEDNEQRRKNWLLPDRLEFSNYRVAEKTEKIDGSECLVLETSMLKPGTSDKLWLDLDHGLAVRKLETHREGVLTERFINSKFKEMAPGIWLPEECKWQRAAPLWAKTHRGQPVLEYQITVLKGSVNDVRDDLFELPKDAQIIDRR